MAIAVPQPGEEISAELFGKPVAEQVNANTDAITAAVPTAWANAALSNGWSSESGFGPVQYRKEANDVLRFRGAAVKTGAPAGAVFTLPTGFRPTKGIRLGMFAHQTGVGGINVIRADINTVGVLTLYEIYPVISNATLYFDNLAVYIGA